jgi:hypothetical protein
MESEVSNGLTSGMLTGVIVFCVAFSILIIASLWKIFEKAGKPGWAAIVPIYNIIVWLEIIGKPWWWLLLMCIPYVGIIWGIWATNLLSKSFGKDVGFTIGMIFLSFIFYPILAFGDARYLGPNGQRLDYAGKELPLV